jgi:SAM-dependent methyltransferase
MIVKFLKKIPILGFLLVKIKRIFKPIPEFKNTNDYWEQRYAEGGNSGEGSYGEFALHKGEVINDFVQRHKIKSVMELGCGDGNQLSYFNFEHYIGFELSKPGIELCKNKYKDDFSKSFFHNSEFMNQKAEFCISLDVIYCIVNDEIYENYMHQLFDSSLEYVLVFSINKDEQNEDIPHLKYRNFTNWVTQNKTDFELVEFIENKFNSKNNIIASDFYFYTRK